MWVEYISLKNYRNLSQIRLEPCEGINIIYGDNAQGKTNLIEAIWLFTGGKNFRGSKETEQIQFEKEKAILELGFYGENRSQTALIHLGQRKGVWLNDVPKGSLSKLCGNFYAVVFSPEHLSLIKEGPQERRKLLDGAICQLMPKYHSYLSQYNRILVQRNALIKDMRLHDLCDSLAIWDMQLAKYGAAIIHIRQRYTEKLEKAAGPIYKGISKGREQLSLLYHTTVDGYLPGMEQGEITSLFVQTLQQQRAADFSARTTLTGPHRDDLTILVDEIPARSFGSQGQQRSCVLALKMGECEILKEITHTSPVILLDDVMSELDNSRRDYLLNHIGDKQVFITCCDKGYFTHLSKGKSFRMEAGALVEENTF